jgi:DNA-binding beta-propeller fold protein YncE
VLGVLVAAAAFGVVEQWAGAARPGLVAALGGVSAPWLALPFLAGALPRSRRGALVLGLAAVLVAIAAFVTARWGFVQTFGSGPATFLWTVLDQFEWLFGAVVSGPVYGWLGRRWRATRSWLAALAVTVPVMIEPALRWELSSWQNVAREPYVPLAWQPYAPVAWAEALAGLALTVAAVVIALRGGPRERPVRKDPGGLARRIARVARWAVTVAVASVGVAAYVLPVVNPQAYEGSGVVIALSADGRVLYAVNEPLSGIRPLWSTSLPTIVTSFDTTTMKMGSSVTAATLGTENPPTQAVLADHDQMLYMANDAGLMGIRLRTGSSVTVGVPSGAICLAVSPDGSTVYVSTNADTIIPVAAATGRPGRLIRLPRGPAKGAMPDYLALTANGKILYVDLQWASAGPVFDEVIGVNLATGKTVPFDYHGRDGYGMVLAPDGRTLYLVTDDEDYAAVPQRWLFAVSTSTGRKVSPPLALADGPNDMAIAPDGRTLYIAGTKTVVKIPLSPATGGPAARPVTIIGWLGYGGEEALVISPDGRNLYVDGDGIQVIHLG